MKKFSLFFLILAGVLLFPAVSRSEIKEGSFEINPFFGYCNAATTRDLCHKDIYGLRLGYNITNRWGVEGAFDYFVSNAKMFHADLLYHLMPEKPLNPFFVAGFGGAHISPLRGDSYNTFMADVGAGVKYSLSERVGLRADVRGVMTHYTNMVVSAGFTFALGGKTPKAGPTLPPAPTQVERPVAAPEPTPEPMPAPAPAPAEVPPPAETPAAVPSPTPAHAPAPENIVLEDIHFDFNKATLTREARKILKKNVRIVKEHPGILIQIEGYACAHGKPEYNMVLSERRANTVKEYFAKAGISTDRLRTISYGKTRLAVPEIPTPKNKNSAEARANRRVHFEVIAE